MALRGRLEQDPDAAEIRMAIERVGKLAPLAPAAAAAEMVSLDTSGEDGEALAVADSSITPEENLLQAEEEQTRAGLLAAVKEAAEKLPADERLYLQIVFAAADPLPAREISKIMQLPVADVYRLKQRTQRWLSEMASRLEKN
jgi:RNA polymerase primary sigma factor